MESLDKAMAREARRLSKNILEPVRVNTMSDIKRVLTEFDPLKNRESPVIPINATIEVSENSKVQKYAVSANTKSKSKRDLLVDGLKMIINRMESERANNDLTEPTEINGRTVYPIKMVNSINGYTWVDSLIKQWMGASRDGITIYWDLDDGYRYKYDIFEHKLTRVKNDV